MGLLIAAYKITKEQEYNIKKDNDMKVFEEEQPIMIMLKNYFGIKPENPDYEEAIKLLRWVGTRNFPEFWLDQSIMAAKINSEWHSSLILYDNPAMTELLRSEGCKIISQEKDKEVINPDAVITDTTNYEELITKLMRKNN